MKYSIPDEETLVKYLAVLREVIVEARFLAYSSDQRVATLLDAIENVPDLLSRWPDVKEEIIFEELRAYEEKYLSGGEKYTKILREDPRQDWQLKWNHTDAERVAE